MRNITLSADEHIIDAARRVAAAEHTTLNEQFRIWLAGYAKKRQTVKNFDATLQELRGQLRVGRKITREQMNAR